MKPLCSLILLLLLNSSFTMKTNVRSLDQLKTKPEATNYEETSRYEDVIRFISELEKSTDKLRSESFGKTEEGRELPLMIFADPPIAQPRAARGKPIIFIMANIHAGEVEGKEAMLALSRRLAGGDLRTLLEKIIILIAPIYNADGNEKISTNNRTAQNGPIGGVGTRENAKGLDLNRDFMKLESAEANSLVRLFNRWNPHLTVDLHTSNGSYHGYHLTYSPTLNPNADPRLIAYERNKMLPAIAKAVRTTHKFRSYYYGNFATRERLNRELDTFEVERSGDAARPAGDQQTKVWRTFDHRPRFGNNYYGLRNRLTILSEAYSYLDFRRRIAVTEAFVTEILKYSAANAAEIRRLTRAADARTIALGRNDKERQIAVQYAPKALPKPVTILVGEVVKKTNVLSGHEMTAMVEDAVAPVKMLDYGLFAAARSVPIARAYLIPRKEGVGTIVEKLRAHGIVVEELARPLTTDVEKFTVEKVTRSPRRIQGHDNVKVTWESEEEKMRFEPGTYLVRTLQPLGLLAAYLLEPESDDGLVAWNFLDAFLEPQKVLPVYKLMRMQDVKRVAITNH